jgi:predicted amidohydrolase YtcJ
MTTGQLTAKERKAGTSIRIPKRSERRENANLIIRNGRVFTVNDRQPWAEAVGVLGDRIVFVGSDAEADAMTGPGTKVIDAGGRLVLPGMIDAHTHCLSAHHVYYRADLTHADSF